MLKTTSSEIPSELLDEITPDTDFEIITQNDWFYKLRNNEGNVVWYSRQFFAN